MSGVVICGGRRVESTIEVVGRGYERLGHQVAYVPTRDYANKMQGSFGPYLDIEDRILRAASAVNADLLVWIMCKQDYPCGLNAALREKIPGMKIAYHSFDDPFIIATDEHKRSIEFDFAITCCAGSIEDYAMIGVPAICLYPPFDEDMHTCAPVNNSALCDVSFIATNIYPPQRYPYSLYNRADIVRAVKDIGSTAIYGPWDKRFSWGGEYGSGDLQQLWRGALKFNELPSVYKASKINLNSHVRPDGYLYLNERFTNVLGSGCFMMVDRVNGIDELQEGECAFVVYESIDDLRDKVKFYIHNDTARERVARAGLELARRRFSNTVFARSTIDFSRKL